MKASEVLREARNILFERGWTRVVREAPGGEVCLEAACSIPITGMPDFLLLYAHDPIEVDVVSALRAATGAPVSLWSWNDAEDRTFDDVIDALDRAEKLALIREES